MRSTWLTLALLTLSLHAETIPTRCHLAAERPVPNSYSMTQLLTCSDVFTDDVLWYLDRLDQNSAQLDGMYDTGNQGAGSVIYVMDTGVLATHDEFMTATGSRVVAGVDVITQPAFQINDDICTTPNRALQPCWNANFAPSSQIVGHGTAVAAAAAGNRIGVAPKATVVAIRVASTTGVTDSPTVLHGLNAIVQHAWSAGAPQFNTAVVNMSFSFISSGEEKPPEFDQVHELMKRMIGGIDRDGNADPNGKHFLFVVCANNIPFCNPPDYLVEGYPAVWGPELPGLITVGGMTKSNQWWTGGCRGSAVEVLAPSDEMFLAWVTAHDDYLGLSAPRHGTSFGTGVVSGIAARALASNPGLLPANLEAIIETQQSRVTDFETAPARGWVATTILPPPPPRRRALR